MLPAPGTKWLSTSATLVGEPPVNGQAGCAAAAVAGLLPVELSYQVFVLQSGAVKVRLFTATVLPQRMPLLKVSPPTFAPPVQPCVIVASSRTSMPPLNQL